MNKELRSQFPFINEADSAPIYLDNGATTQKPAVVIKKITDAYKFANANVHRGVYGLSQRATENYENARATVAKFLANRDKSEIIFCSGTTDAMNLVASCWSHFLKKDDVVLIGPSEHHSSFVPWQQAAYSVGAKFEVMSVGVEHRFDVEAYKTQLKKLPKVVVLHHVSNVTGEILPIRNLAVMAKKAGAIVVVDGAQAVAHHEYKEEELEFVDFYCFSFHKLYGPTGLGVLWGKKKHLEKMSPYKFGGEMIESVSSTETTWNQIPWKFEAGTPNFIGAVGGAAAIDFLVEQDVSKVVSHENALTQYALSKLLTIEGLKVLGPKTGMRASLVSFYFNDIHSNDIVSYLDNDNICMRVGHHCTQPFHNSIGIESSLRVSFAMYNTIEEFDFFYEKLMAAVNFFRKKGRAKKTEAVKSTEMMDWLKPVLDPELKISFVELGLIYDIVVEENNDLRVSMTLTSPGCPMGVQIMTDIKRKLEDHPRVNKVDVELVWEPKWNPADMASEEAKEVLGIW